MILPNANLLTNVSRGHAENLKRKKNGQEFVQILSVLTAGNNKTMLCKLFLPKNINNGEYFCCMSKINLIFVKACPRDEAQNAQEIRYYAYL